MGNADLAQTGERLKSVQVIPGQFLSSGTH